MLAVECAFVFAEVLQGDCSKDERSNSSLQAAANLRALEVFHGSVPRNVIVSLPFSQARALDTVTPAPRIEGRRNSCLNFTRRHRWNSQAHFLAQAVINMFSL